MNLTASGITDIGLKREGNEDSFSTEDSLGLYIVADGMGGHLAGEVASRISVELINKCYRKWLEEEASAHEIYGEPDDSLTLQGNYILGSIRLANRVIYEMALENKKYHGMGTTIAILLVTSTVIIAANVGDSRLYLIRDGTLEGLSKDHTIVAEQVDMGMMTKEEAETSPLKHILTRNLGSAETVEPDIFEIEPSNNDRFILCSDGLTDLVNEEEILAMTSNEEAPKELCRKFLDKVIKRGAHDNTTVVSVFVSDLEKTGGGFFKKIGLFFADLFRFSKK